MSSDAHAHPYDLFRVDPVNEAERRNIGAACAASAWNEESFAFHERLSREAAAAGAPPIVLCFGVHPQLPAEEGIDKDEVVRSLAFLELAIREKRVGAVGESGFDLFDAGYRATEVEQEALFRVQLDLALEAGLPLVLHLRKAMHRAFEFSREFARLPAVVLHSYSGTAREAESLVGRGVNAYFSFGTPVLLNHKRAMEAAAVLPLDRLLTETDAPYQPLRGRARSTWKDLPLILAAIADLRAKAGRDGARSDDLERAADRNFRAAYGIAG